SLGGRPARRPSPGTAAAIRVVAAPTSRLEWLMRSRTTLLLRVPILLSLAVAALVAAGGPATASAVRAAPGQVALAVTPSFNATIRLSNCSASLVRYPTS